MADVPYEATPGTLQLVGATAETQGLAVYLATPGALLLAGIKATVILPIQRVLNPDLPSGVRMPFRPAYPRVVQISGERHMVRSWLEEQDLIKGIDRKPKKKATPRKTKTVYTIRRG
jgi:hypothetical protein